MSNNFTIYYWLNGILEVFIFLMCLVGTIAFMVVSTIYIFKSLLYFLAYLKAWSYCCMNIIFREKYLKASIFQKHRLRKYAASHQLHWWVYSSLHCNKQKILLMCYLPHTKNLARHYCGVILKSIYKLQESATVLFDASNWNDSLGVNPGVILIHENVYNQYFSWRSWTNNVMDAVYDVFWRNFFNRGIIRNFISFEMQFIFVTFVREFDKTWSWEKTIGSIKREWRVYFLFLFDLVAWGSTISLILELIYVVTLTSVVGYKDDKIVYDATIREMNSLESLKHLMFGDYLFITCLVGFILLVALLSVAILRRIRKSSYD